MRLETTDSQLHELASLDDGAREGTEFLRVPRAALRALLRDHYTLFTHATHRRGHVPEAGTDQRSLEP